MFKPASAASANAGIPGTVVFIVTLVQGPGPPSSIMPGIDRFAGIVCGPSRQAGATARSAH
jgi:hypothetical protein